MSFQNRKLWFLTVLSLSLICTVAGFMAKGGGFSARKTGRVLTEIPKRTKSALSGSRFISISSKMTNAQREKAIVKELKNGNVPEYLRHTQVVSFRKKLKDGKFHQVEINVMPDYLAVGSDKDFVRIPMSPLSAQQIADRYNLVLPTASLVDEIYKSASLKYAPKPLPPGKKMVTNDFYQKHNQLIEKQRKGRDLRQLAGGHKKDVVLTNRLKWRPKQVAIYGWHRSNGKVIQPLSLVHGNYYADYSHGIRLIDPWIKVDGKRRHINTILSSHFLAPLVSNEGKLVAAQAYRSAPAVVAKLNKKKTMPKRVASLRKKKTKKQS